MAVAICLCPTLMLHCPIQEPHLATEQLKGGISELRCALCVNCPLYHEDLV